MNVALIIGLLISTIFTFLCLVHLYWAIVGEVNTELIIPEVDSNQLFRPNRFITAIIGLGLMLFAFIILGYIGVFELPDLEVVFNYGIWIVGWIFLARSIGDFKFIGFFKTIDDTKFALWDTRVYSPLCLLISIGIFIIIYNV